MVVEWKVIKSSKLNLQCPICNHQTFPPEYPHCEHVVFVYVEPYSPEYNLVDPVFAYITRAFARQYIELIEQNKSLVESFGEHYGLLKYSILKVGRIPSGIGKIKLTKKLLTGSLFKVNTTIFDMRFIHPRYPSKVKVAFQDSKP